jgi:hypothetical protein
LLLVDLSFDIFLLLLPLGGSLEMTRHREMLWALWQAYAELVFALYANETLLMSEDGQTISMERYADEAERAAVNFVEAYLDFMPGRKNLYLHLIMAHVPTQIRKFGFLLAFSGMALEAGHIDIKRCVRWNSNFLKAGALKAVRKDGSFSTSMIGRVAQVLKSDLVRRATALEVPLPGDGDVMLKKHRAAAKQEKREAKRASVEERAQLEKLLRLDAPGLAKQ